MDEKMFIFLTDTRLPVLSPRVSRERALLSAPVTHTPPICLAATRSTMENGAVWEMEAIYNCRIRTHPPSQLALHSETKREPPLHANVTQLPFNRSDKRRVGGRSDIKSKLSQVIESSHWERASARRLSRVLMGALEVEGSVFVCVIGNDNWLLISPNMFFSSATNVAAEPALRHTAINHQTFGYLSLSHARVRFPPSYFSFSPAPSLSLPYLSGAWAGKHGKWNALD